MLYQWGNAISQDGVKFIRFMIKAEDTMMLEAFYMYMLGLDTEQEDTTILLELPFISAESFSEEILKYLETIIEEWNTAEIPDTIPFERIEWKADYNLRDKTNQAYLAVANMNAFVQSLSPDGVPKISFIFKPVGIYDEEELNRWLEQALKLSFNKVMVWGMADYIGFDTMKELVRRYGREIVTLYPNINLPNAIEQISEKLAQESSEENTHSATFRLHLIKLMRATADKNATEIDRQAKLCIEIILDRVQYDSNWIAQMVVVYTLLHTYHIGNKELENALFFAEKAIETALLSEGKLDASSSFRLQGNSYILKGNVLILQKELRTAADVYLQGADAYEQGGDPRLCCECLRISGDCWDKIGEDDKELACYVRAFKFIDKFSANDILGSTFALLLLKLYQHPKRQKVLTTEEMEQALSPVLGSDWLDILHTHKRNIGDYEQYADLV